MAPDASLWQLALVSAGSGLIAVTLRHFSKRPRVKVVIDTGMATLLVWQGCMIAYLCYHATQGDLLSIDLPMLRLFLIAAGGTICFRFLLLGARHIRTAPMGMHIVEPECPLVPMSPGELPSEQRKQLARR
jgi:hypothetical protein